MKTVRILKRKDQCPVSNGVFVQRCIETFRDKGEYKNGKYCVTVPTDHPLLSQNIRSFIRASHLFK